MNMTIFGENIAVTDSIRDYIHKKFFHLHKPEKMTTVEFRIGSTKTDKYIHFHCKTSYEEIVIKSHDKNLYHAIDELMKKIHMSFVKEKQKTHNYLHH